MLELQLRESRAAARRSRDASAVAAPVLSASLTAPLPRAHPLSLRTDAVMVRALGARDQVMVKLGVTPEDLATLKQVPFYVTLVGLFINILMLAAMGNFAWLKATALSDGQPFTAYLSLTGVQFGTPTSPTADSKYFCGAGKSECSLGGLCSMTSDPSLFENGLPKTTPVEAWCSAARAGAAALGLLWFGFIPGLAATAFTGLYAAKEIEQVGRVVAKVEQLGFTDYIQRVIISGCWAALWAFTFIAMTVYASMIPDTLGWGVVELEASFGLLRFSFVLVSIFGSILISTFFNLWNAENVAEAYLEFKEARLFSWKKALYLELMLQVSHREAQLRRRRLPRRSHLPCAGIPALSADALACSCHRSLLSTSL